MSLEIDQLITLEDNKKYIITSDLVYEGERYIFLAGVKEDESDINKEFVIAKAVNDNGEAYIEDVTDEELLKTLISMFEIKED